SRFRHQRRKNQDRTPGNCRTPQGDDRRNRLHVDSTRGDHRDHRQVDQAQSGTSVKAYDSVRDTFSKIGVPTEEQAKAYIAMLSSTASLKGDVAAGSIFDFSLAAEAARNWRRRNSAKATGLGIRTDLL